MSVRVEIDSTDKIMSKRHLGKNGEANKMFTKECANSFSDYVPFKTGKLRDSMSEVQNDKIVYSAPHAKKQYYTNKGGKYWDKRAWSDKGKTIVKTIADFVGGKGK